MSEGWFCFQRGSDLHRPDSFQSPELDSLFLEEASIRLSAVWCISCRDKRLIYFWGDRTLYNETSDAGGRLGYCARRFLPFFEEFNSSIGVLLAGELIEAALSDPIKYVGSKRIGNLTIEIYAGKGFIFLYQLGTVPRDGKADLSVRSYLLDRSERGHDLSRQAEHFFDRIPKEILKVSMGAKRLFNQFFGPNCYDVLREAAVPFAWPWQRCLEIRDGAVQPKQIPTISLVMDLRNSSSAMLLTPDAPRFAIFVDKVVEDARELIVTNGGYFDKDTGDGLVGHFEAPENFDGDVTALNNALLAAKLINTNTTRLCAEYQKNLSLALRGLGCAIGLFFGRAVWLHSWRGVRAIGSSVVNASRICSNASAGEVGCCNTIAHVLRTGKVSGDVIRLTGVSRPIKISEVRDEAIPEAYFLRLG